MTSMLKLVFFVPESHKELVKQAVFSQGAGRYQGYDHCSWEVVGKGQFKPLKDSQPFIGQHDKIEKVTEYRVETICDSVHIKAVLVALLAAHPYQQPAYDVIPIMTIDDV